MTLEARISALAAQVGTTVQVVNGKIGSLATLNTVQKASLVLALNELKAALDAVPALTTLIDDTTAATNKVYSSTKTAALISQTVANLLNGADGSNDTLKELADRISALAQADTGLVSAAGVQSFTDPQKAQARTNINAASATDLATLTTNVGNTDRDFVSDFNTAYNA